MSRRRSVFRKIFRLLVVLLAGSLWSLPWVAQTLFNVQPDRHLAGVLAGRLFEIETYVALAVAGLSLAFAELRRKFSFGYGAAVLLAVNEWVLRSFMDAARANGRSLGLSFGAWHGVSAVLYLMACLAMLVLIWNEDFR